LFNSVKRLSRPITHAIMIIVMKSSASKADTKRVIKRIHRLGLQEHLSQGETQTIIGVVGDTQRIDKTGFEVLAGVERTVRVTQPFKLASHEFSPVPTVIDVKGVKIGGTQTVVMAGPCSVESRSQILETAHAVKEAGAQILRGGAFNPAPLPIPSRGWARKA